MLAKDEPEDDMPSIAFMESLPFVLRWEGGYVNHPSDPGGATNRGVTQAVYEAWRRDRGMPPQDVRLLADHEMHAIYEANYWQVGRCDDLQRRLDLAQFDTAVNMGPSRAIRFLQAALGCPVDGGFGAVTLSAVQQCRDVTGALATYCAEREAFYDRLIDRKPALAVFHRGWSNRLNALRREIGLLAYEGTPRGEAGDEGPVKRIPDFGVDPEYDL